MLFESLPRTPRAEELIDKAFSRAARTGRARSGTEGQLSMLQTAGNVLSDNLGHIAEEWPDFDDVDPFYRELAGTLIDVDRLRASLSEASWAGRKCGELVEEYRSRMRKASPEHARKYRKQAFARMADVVREVEDELLYIGQARDLLKTLPDIRPDEPTIVIAGYPNVGKTSFVNHVTHARNKTASYPFTTTGILVGHLERGHIRYQLVDTPGLLDRPASDRNEIEQQAISAITHAADCVLVFVDPSGRCGYPLDEQLALRDQLERDFSGVPVLTIGTKSDLSIEVEAEQHMSITEDRGVEQVIAAAIDAIDYKSPIPSRESAGDPSF